MYEKNLKKSLDIEENYCKITKKTFDKKNGAGGWER
jgi:hypothetical protein